MTSMSKPQAAAQAESYYTKENYYMKNSELGFYHGDSEALKQFGIEENELVTQETYNALLNGFNPKTGDALANNAGDENRRAGIDVTQSANKSLSVLVEGFKAHGLDEKAQELLDAHEKANQAAMNKVKEYALSRIYDEEGNRIKVNVDMAYASFQHDLSRLLDPQIHTHNFIFNLVTYTDPKTGETKVLSLSNEEIYRQKMLIGQLYRSELAANLSDLGYTINVTNAKEGFFEIEGVSENQIKAFSQMSEMLEKAYGAQLEDLKKLYPNAPTERLKEYIKMAERRAKQKVDRDEVLEFNKNRMLDLGMDQSFFSNFAPDKSKTPLTEEEKRAFAVEHLNKTAQFLSETASTFTKESILKEALKYGLSNGLRERDYISAFSSSNVVQLDSNVFSTHEIIEAEKEMIRLLHRGKGEDLSIVEDSQKIDDFINSKYGTMTQGQRAMTKGLLTGKDRYLLVQGDAGSGKTYSMKAIKEYMDQHHEDYELVGISYTGKAADGLEEESGIKSTTIHKYLMNEAARTEETKKRIIIIDEAGMAGSIQLEKIMRIAQQNGDKVVFVGDTKQFASIAAGNAFADLQKYGCETVYMEESLRQKTKHTKAIVKNIKDKDAEAAINLLEQKKAIVEGEKKDLVEQITDNYVSLREQNRKKTLIIASRNADRIAINDAIREKLGLKGDMFNIKEGVNLSGVAAHYTSSYEVGFTLTVSDGIDGFKSGERLEIIGIKDTHTLIVRDPTAKNPTVRELNVYESGAKISAFKDGVKQFAAGDEIIFTKNIETKELRVKNGVKDKIKSIDENGNVVTFKNKKFNINDMPFIDHGYAITDVKSQGMTANNVIVLADAQMAHYNSFYVQATRAKSNLKIYTNNVTELKANITKEQNAGSTLKYTMEENTNGLTGANTRNVQADTKEPTRHTEQASGTREADHGDLLDLGSYVERAIQTIANNEEIRRDFENAKNHANTLKEFTMAAQINEIKKELPPQALLTALDLPQDDYKVFVHKSGEWRIQHGTHTYNVSDFLTKHMKMSWTEAKELLDREYAKHLLTKDVSVQKSSFLTSAEQEAKEAKARAIAERAAEAKTVKDALKVNICEFLDGNEWTFDKKGSTLNYGAYKSKDESAKIIINKLKNGTYFYRNVYDDADRGTITNFLKNRGFTTIAAQAKYINTPPDERAKVEKHEINVADREYKAELAREKWKSLEELKGRNEYLSDKRKISEHIYNAYKVKIDERGNISTPLYQFAEMKSLKSGGQFRHVGYNRKLINYYAPQGEQLKDLCEGVKGLTILEPKDKGEITHVVVSESSIDAWSYIELNNLDPKHTMVIATNGETNEKTLKDLERLNGYVKGFDKARKIIAMDNDKAGERFTQAVKARIPDAENQKPQGEHKDFNDALKAQKQTLENEMRKEEQKQRDRGGLSR